MSGDALPFRFDFGVTTAKVHPPSQAPQTANTSPVSHNAVYACTLDQCLCLPDIIHFTILQDPPPLCLEVTVPDQLPDDTQRAFTSVTIDRGRGVYLKKARF